MFTLPESGPFVLCEDARSDSAGGRLFVRPVRTIAARRLQDVEPAFDALRAGLASGLYAAGWLSYEAGFVFEPRLVARADDRPTGDFPLVWFGLFEAPQEISAQTLTSALPDGRGAWLSAPRPRISPAQYAQAFDRVKAYITAGDCYQVNLSYRADLTVLGHPLEAYAQLRGAGRGGWSALVHDGDSWLLSTSPELFFRLTNGIIEARPMKGTARRGATEAEDRRAAEDLCNDPKERAENIMIVDLLRNDISKLAKRGSVHVPDLLTLETYPTLHTLTSTVRAEIKERYDLIDVLRALFPCGSITGAPKLRAMEIIAELERDPRRVYTGSIGWMAPNGDAEFNVAIRTVAIADGKAEIGLGSAVVYDSTCASEWEECRTKARFVTSVAKPFELVETMRWEPPDGLQRLELHLQRLAASARALDFAFDEAKIRDALAQVADLHAPRLVRLLLNREGSPSVEVKPLPAFPSAVADVALAPLPAPASDFRLRHKTTQRDFYDHARGAQGGDEVVFFDPEGFLTEGSFTNVFVPRDGVLLTPPASRGLLPGVLRAELIASGRAREADLRADDLKQGFFLGNSVRGLHPARLAST